MLLRKECHVAKLPYIHLFGGNLRDDPDNTSRLAEDGVATLSPSLTRAVTYHKVNDLFRIHPPGADATNRLRVTLEPCPRHHNYPTSQVLQLLRKQ
jgi:hypothetical protein